MSNMDVAQRTARNADQVELCAFRMASASIDEGLVDEAISGESEGSILAYDDPEEDSEEWLKLDDYNESEQGRIVDELQQRAGLLETLYPFELRQSSLHYKPSGSVRNKIYETLLLTSLTTRRQGRPWLRLVDSFERLSNQAVKTYFQCSDAWWTGSHSPGHLPDLIGDIHRITGELEWAPDPNLPDLADKANDAGLDFINYRNLGDFRVGGLFFFGQSACGDDWFTKTAHELRENRHRNLFRQPYAHPVRIFTIPYLITGNHEKMVEAASNISGLVFDRARLTNMLSRMQNDKDIHQEIDTIYRLADQECS